MAKPHGSVRIGPISLFTLIIVLCLNAGIPCDFPCATLVVFAAPSLVSSAKVANRVFGMEVGCDGLASLLPCDVVHLHLNADGLLFQVFNLSFCFSVHNVFLRSFGLFPFCCNHINSKRRR